MRLIKKNVASFGKVNLELSEKLDRFFISEMSKDKRWQNYKPETLDLVSHLTYDILVDEITGDILTGCGVYHGNRYGQGIYRIMNRVFLNPKYRQNNKEYPFWATRYLLSEQLQLCEGQIDFPFVSREGKFAHHFLDLWTKEARETGLGEWVVSEGFAHVAPKGRNKKCYQRIAYPADKINPFLLITENEWLELREFEC